MTQLPLDEVLPLSDDDDSSDYDGILGADARVSEMDGDTAMDQERRRRNREAARKVRMKKNRRHEDVKQVRICVDVLYGGGGYLPSSIHQSPRSNYQSPIT